MSSCHGTKLCRRQDVCRKPDLRDTSQFFVSANILPIQISTLQITRCLSSRPSMQLNKQILNVSLFNVKHSTNVHILFMYFMSSVWDPSTLLSDMHRPLSYIHSFPHSRIQEVEACPSTKTKEQYRIIPSTPLDVLRMRLRVIINQWDEYPDSDDQHSECERNLTIELLFHLWDSCWSRNSITSLLTDISCRDRVCLPLPRPKPASNVQLLRIA